MARVCVPCSTAPAVRLPPTTVACGGLLSSSVRVAAPRPANAANLVVAPSQCSPPPPAHPATMEMPAGPFSNGRGSRSCGGTVTRLTEEIFPIHGAEQQQGAECTQVAKGFEPRRGASSDSNAVAEPVSCQSLLL